MELAVVLVIVALLLGGLLVPLSTQRDGEAIRGTAKSLGEVNEALLGYAISNGRLPCPASASSSGLESFCNNSDPAVACVATTTLQTLGRCSNPSDGFVPAATLGLTPVDSSGLMLDAWNNRIRYAVSFIADPATSGSSSRYIFTGVQGMKLRTLGSMNNDPNLRVCPDAACATPLTMQAVAVVWSTGKNAGSGGSGSDEIENPNPNSGAHPDPTANKFVSHISTDSAAAGGEFDDIVQWMSPNILYNRMISAGQLP